MVREKNGTVYKELIESLTTLLKTGDWETSLFLRTAQKKILDIIEEAEENLKELYQTAGVEKDEFAIKEKQGYIRIYVSIYQADYNNLNKWQNTLNRITEYSLTRPIYGVEDHILEAIRTKASANEAYAIVYIQPSDIIPPYTGKAGQDRFGHELLTVKEGTILPTNIYEFVHNEKKYAFKMGKLRLKSNVKA